nr:helicase [Helicobacter pylori]
MQEQIAMEHQVQQAEWKMEQEAKKRGIIPMMREEYHAYRNPHLINKIAPEIWGFLSLENSQDRLDAYAFLIMDRWAHYFPQTMKTKEKGAIMSLIDAVIKQTKMETKALDRMEAQIKRAQGVSDMELLREAQINQYYYLLKADYIMQDLAHQMDLETLKKTGIKREDFYQI